MKRACVMTVCCILLCSLLCSCRSLASSMTDEMMPELLPVSTMPDLDNYQLLQGTMPGFGDVVFEAYLSCDGKSLEMYLFAPTGQTLATISYDENGLDVQSSFIEDPLAMGPYVLMDIQLCYADFQALSEVLAKKGLNIVQNAVEGGVERTISYKKKEIYEIYITDALVTVRNSLRGYEYSLELL